MALPISEKLRKGRFIFLTIGLTVAIVGLLIFDPGSVRLQTIDWTNFGTLLLPYLVVTLLIERTVEVIFGITREPEQRERDGTEQALRNALTSLRVTESTDAATIAGSRSLLATTSVGASGRDPQSLPPADVAVAVAERLSAVQAEQIDAEARNTVAAFYWSMSLGFVAAWLGFRLMTGVLVDVPQSWPTLTGRPAPDSTVVRTASGNSETKSSLATTNPDPTLRTGETKGESLGLARGGLPNLSKVESAVSPPTSSNRQARDGAAPTASTAPKPARKPPLLFVLLDVVLTACLLSGGADGVHHITSVMSKYLESLRKRAQENARG